MRANSNLRNTQEAQQRFIRAPVGFETTISTGVWP